MVTTVTRSGLGQQPHHPEVTLGSLGGFETCPDWVPVMDTGQQFARISFKTTGDHWFDHSSRSAAKVVQTGEAIVSSQSRYLADSIAMD